MKQDVAILIRVYDRTEDLKYNLNIIRQTWLEYNYYIIVVSNGYSKGYRIDDLSIGKIDKLVILQDNSGHKKGNSQLLLAGIGHIPQDCKYTLILEADTWMYGDQIISKYISLLKKEKKIVWASADWYDKDYALATDFAIIKSDYIKKNSGLFDFEIYPECHIANYLRDTGAGFIWINENMPVHVPSYVAKYPYINDSSQRRFYVFPRSRMVTHHIEFLKNGISRKKRYFNIVAGTDFFVDEKVIYKKWELFKMYFWIGFSKLFIKRTWFNKKYYREIND